MRIGRYDNPYKCVSYASISPRARIEPVHLEASDGGLSSGMLYTTGRHRTVVCFMHPKADMSRHYAIPALLDGGFAVFGQNSRWLNNDDLCVHETLLLDVAAGLDYLRSVGFERIVLVGNSGGGSLYGLYQAQAVTTPPGRLTQTPAGDPVNLNELDLMPADGFIHLAAHLGEGRILMSMIDPSVTDESDPLSCDPSLDPFHPDNGFRQPPESSHYAPAFVQAYRAAQRARVERIDAIARASLVQRDQARHALGQPEFHTLPWAERSARLREAVVCPYLVVYRTEADLRAFDLGLDPSERDAGSLFSYRPDLTNYMEFGFGRICTPRSWLSTWSGVSSNADFVRNAPLIEVPSLVIYYDGDNAIFPSESQAAFDAIGATDKELYSVPGDHYGFAVGTQERSGAKAATDIMVRWLHDHFPI